MTTIPFPVVSAPGQRPHESAGRLINAYAEPLSAGARAQNAWRRAPGLRAFASSPQSGNRGQILVGNTLWSAFAGNVTAFTSAGAATSIGALAGTKKVFWAANNKAPTPNLVVVDPDNGAYLVTTSGVPSFTGGGVLPAPNSVCFLDGYFFFTTGDGRCFASALNDTTVNALDFTTAQAKRGGLLRAVPFVDLYLCGPQAIEVYHDTAEPTGFPFSRVQVIGRGILGPNCITGFEDGFGKGLILLGDDGCVYALNGYTPSKISTPDVDRAVAAFRNAGGDPATIEMFPYVAEGHACVVLRCSAFTWVFDVDTVRWHERQSYGATTWRATGAVSAFGKWLCGDTNSGALIEITKAVGNELGTPLPFVVESGPVSGFPAAVAVPLATFDLARGVGTATGSDPSQTDPTVEIQWSDDGGVSWSKPLIRKLGAQAVVDRKPIRVARTGMTTNSGRRWRLTVGDDVDVILTGGDMQSETRAA
ncbi:MAG TPA: hypothetical protein VFB45_10580 [Pseudolabrys sp.]|nr:hypothetical protein [Pseudolabrys sp.]